MYVLNAHRLKYLRNMLGAPMNIIINYSSCQEGVDFQKSCCTQLKEKGLISNFHCVNDCLDEILAAFQLREADFKCDLHFKICLYGMAALHFCEADYLCFFTGDSTPLSVTNFIRDAIAHDVNSSSPHTYMLSWTSDYRIVEREAYAADKNFYYTNNFSDQNFVINTTRFSDRTSLLKNYCLSGFPHVDAFESRFFYYMRLHGIPRCVYKYGRYDHKNWPLPHQ